MSSLTKTTTRRQKTKRLGPGRVIRPEQYDAIDVNSKLECIRALIPLGLMRIHAFLEGEVCPLTGRRYAQKAAQFPGRRHGSNPGSVRLAAQRHPLRIPRVQYVAGDEISLQALDRIYGLGTLDELLRKHVLYGISCRNDEVTAAGVLERWACRVQRCLGP